MTEAEPRFKKSTLIVVCFFLCYFITGIFTHNDYGIAWDEGSTRGIGMVSAKFILTTLLPDAAERFPAFANVPDLRVFNDRFYGVAFELPLVGAEKVVLGEKSDMYDVYMLRHLCVFLFFFVSMIFLYHLLLYRFKSWIYALLGCTMMILSPRIFADSNYNSKDIPLLGSFIITMYFMVRYMDHKSYKFALLFGVATAYTIGVRVVGLIIPFLAIAFIFWDLVWHSKDRASTKTILLTAGVYLITTAVFTVVFWPFLWPDPLRNLPDAFNTMSAFPRWRKGMLYLGEKEMSYSLPWHYGPVWLSITTPLVYLALFLAGIWKIIAVAVRSKLKFYTTPEERADLMFLGLFVGPFLAVILFNSVLYDGWRQLFFVYGAFVMIAISGFRYLEQKLKESNLGFLKHPHLVVWALLVINFGTTLYFMVRNHPFQNVYFNALVGTESEKKFDGDYWGLSYRQGLQFIAATDKRDSIRVKPHNKSCFQNLLTLAPEDRSRIVFVTDDPDYFLTEYRNAGNPFVPMCSQNGPAFEINVNGSKIMSVFRCR